MLATGQQYRHRTKAHPNLWEDSICEVAGNDWRNKLGTKPPTQRVIDGWVEYSLRKYGLGGDHAIRHIENIRTFTDPYKEIEGLLRNAKTETLRELLTKSTDWNHLLIQWVQKWPERETAFEIIADNRTVASLCNGAENGGRALQKKW